MNHLKNTFIWLKDLLTLPSPMEMMRTELLEAQRQKLREESLRDYSAAMVAYNDSRIKRLESRLKETTE